MRRQHKLMAALYDRSMEPLEKADLSLRRDRLAGSVQGRVLEIGAGTGANLRHYGPSELLVVTEPDSAMFRKLLEKKAARHDTSLPVITDSKWLPFPDAAFDTVVSTLVLCSVKQPRQALDEVRRVLRPGGAFLFLEHVRGAGRKGVWQDRIQPLWSFLMAGCHPNRNTVKLIRERGFDISRLQFFNPAEKLSGLAKLGCSLVVPFVEGTAVKPSV